MSVNMQRSALVFWVLILVFQPAFSLPQFTGMRDDDKPIFGRDGGVQAKNANVDIPDIEDILLTNEEMIVRIYSDHRTFRTGGHPYDLKEIHVKNDVATMLWYPPCLGDPETPRTSSDEAWRVMQEQDFFTIRDYRNFPLPTVVVDGQVQQQPPTADGDYYVVQIKTAIAYRRFIFSTTSNLVAGSQDVHRFLATLAAINANFDSPTCFRTGQ